MVTVCGIYCCRVLVRWIKPYEFTAERIGLPECRVRYRLVPAAAVAAAAEKTTAAAEAVGVGMSDAGVFSLSVAAAAVVVAAGVGWWEEPARLLLAGEPPPARACSERSAL